MTMLDQARIVAGILLGMQLIRSVHLSCFGEPAEAMLHFGLAVCSLLGWLYLNGRLPGIILFRDRYNG
jgi:hypothetical protein